MGLEHPSPPLPMDSNLSHAIACLQQAKKLYNAAVKPGADDASNSSGTAGSTGLIVTRGMAAREQQEREDQEVRGFILRGRAYL